jgi:hypothetical protein
MATFPYYTEPTHDRGVITNAASNAARDTTISAAEGRLIVDAEDKVFLLEPNKHPLVTLLTNVGKVWDGKAWTGSGLLKKATGNPEFSWFEDFYGGRYAKVSGTYTDAAGQAPTVTGAGSSSGNIFTTGDIVKNYRTGEIMVVTYASSTTVTLTVRSFGATAAAAGADGDGLYIIGNVNEENAGARNVNSTRSSKESNYTQIFRSTLAVSGTEKESDLYGGKDLPYMRAKKATEHALDIERAFWWSEKGSDVAGTQTNHARRATGGVHEFINSNNAYVQDQGGPLTAPDLNTFLREGFTYGNTTKVLFAGGIVIQAINEIARGQIQTKVKERSYGVNIVEYITPFGTINIVHNPLFVNDWAGHAYLLDLDCFKYRFMNNRDTKLRVNVQAPDIDGQVDEYLTEAGLQRAQAAKCAMLKGVTA